MPNETHVQLASRLLTNWDQYCNLRNVNDFNSLKELIVSDKLYETLDNETAVHINIKQEQNWFKPIQMGKECDMFYACKGKSFSDLHIEHVVIRMTHERVLNISLLTRDGNENHLARDCNGKYSKLKNEKKETFQVQCVQPKVDLEPLKYVIVYINGKAINCVLDSGTQIFICNSDTFPDSSNDEFGKTTLSSAFRENVEAKLIKTAIALDNNSLNHPMDCLVAITDKLNADALIPPALYESLCSTNDKNNKKENEIFAESAGSSITFSNYENEAECGKDIFYVESDSDNINFNSDYTKMKDEQNTCDYLEKVRAEHKLQVGFNPEFTKRIGSSPRFSCPGYPASNGLVERWNKVLKDMIHHVIREDPRSWDQQLPFLLFAYREVPNTTTGVSPFRLLYGREARGPLAILKSSWAGEIHLPTNISQSAADYLQEMKINMEKAAESASLTAAQKQKAYGDYFNKRSSVKNFSIGEQVVLLIPDSSNKIYARWTGPGEIIQHHPPHSYKVKLSDGIVRHVHVNKIRKYHPRALAVGVIFEDDHEFGEMHPTPNLSRSTSERVLHQINLNHLKESEREQVLAIVLKHQTLFTSDVKIAKVGTHRIRLKPNIERKKTFVYRILESLKIKVDEQIEELCDLI
ncbi:retrovirus-related Pol polyprotein from transposon 17.6 [Trichonephila clavipes]|nr:retrovirus-related Pol polyprotein from transposon 17.6 [Trichonephila clavipes]